MRNRLLQSGSMAWSQILPGNLLQCGVSLIGSTLSQACGTSLHGSTHLPGAGSSMEFPQYHCLPGTTTYPSTESSHLLQHGVLLLLHRLPVNICSVFGVQELQEDSMAHHSLPHGLQENLCSGALSTFCSSFCTSLAVCRAVSHTFLLLPSAAITQQCFPLLKSVISNLRYLRPLLLMTLALASSRSILELHKLLEVCH